MRKCKIIILIIIVLSTFIYSQTIQDYGFKLGYVNSLETITNQPNNIKIRSKNGYSFSIFLDLFNLHGISITPEIKYIRKGVKWLVPDGNFPPDYIPDHILNIYHDYLSIPIYFSYRIPLSFGTPFISLAPRYDILINSYNDDYENDYANLIHEDFNNDFGGTVSIGFIPKLGIFLNPFIELSYNLDFTSTYSNSINSIKNNAFEINIGVLFR